MKITVKRRTWLLGIIMPINFKFNDKEVASLVGLQEKEVPIPDEQGYLEYKHFLDRSAGVNVRAGDVVTIKETSLNKMLNIIFFSTFIYLITTSSYTLRTGSLNFDELTTIVGILLLTALLILTVVSYFFSSYKLVVENR